MALVFRGKSECSVCSKILDEEDRIVMFPHFIGDQNHHLWRYSDSGMHGTCFLSWEYRKEFIDIFNNLRGNITWGNGTYHQMKDDGEIIVMKR